MTRRLRFHAFAPAAVALAALVPRAVSAADLVTWPSQYTVRPWEASRLTAADVVGPDGIVYPDFTGVGVTGGIPDINNAGVRATYTVFNVTAYGANGSDTISDNLNVAAAAAAARSFLNANPANKAVLYFPAGTYYLSAPVVFTQGNIVIDGDGPTSTFIKLQTEVGQTGALFNIKRDPAFAGYLTATTLVPRGGNTLTLNADPAANGFSVGNWVRLAPTLSGAGTTLSDRYSNPDNHVVFNDASYHLGRILFAKVTALDSGARTVTLDRTFTHDYFVSESPQLRRVSLAENCGIQDLTIETLAATATIDPINFEYTANSWIKNIKTVKAKSWPFTLNTSARFEVRDSQFLGTWIFLQQGGGVAYLGWTSFTTDVLMENCQASDLRHMAIFQASNRSVIRGCTFTGKSVQSPQLHGRFPHENLIEGSIFDTRIADGSGSTRGITAYGSDQANSLVHGANGPRNVFYNNQVLSGMGASVFGGTSEGFIFAYNRILKTDDVEAKPAITAMDRSFDFIVRGNIFQAISTLPAISLSEGTCTGWSITDNKFYGTSGYLYEGDSVPELAHNNRFFPIATTPDATTTPEVASIYAWQKANAATARLVLASDRRTVSDTGGTTDFTVVRVQASTASSLTVNLSASPVGLSVPATVTIPAGQTAATFIVTGINVSGEQLVTLTAAASGLLGDTEKVAVLDQDVAQPNFGGDKWPVPPVGLPVSWKAGNYGQVTVPGSQSFNSGNNTWSITGGGLRTESFHGSLARSGRRFVYQTVDGDGEIRARITAASGEQQVGLMIADDEATLTDFIWVEPNGRVYSSSNDAQNGLGNGVPTERATAGARIVPCWLRLKRVGSVFTAYRSTVTNPATEGDWTVLATVDLYLNPSTDYKSPAVLDQRMHFGFFINSGSASVAASATFTDSLITGAIVGTTPPPAAPTGLTVSLVGNTQANLAWADNATDETGYQIDVRLGSSTAWTPLITLPADSTTYTHTGLLDGVTYAYRIRAVRNTDNITSAYTATASVNTSLTTTPLAPTNPVAVGLYPTQIQLSWTDGAHNESGYQLERSTASGSGFSLLTTLGAGANGYIDSNLPDGTRYYYRVRAINSLGNSAYSSVVFGITPLNAPDEFYITSTSPTAIAMVWNDNAANESGYAVERSLTSGSGFSQIATTAANATSYTDSTVVNGTRYYYRVRAVNALAQSEYAAEASALASAYQPAEFHEPFNHALSPTSVVGRPGTGSGVSGNWLASSPPGDTLIAGSFEAGRIAASGNRLQFNNSGVKANLTAGVQAIINPPANGSRTFWLSFNYRTTSTVAANNGLRLILQRSDNTPLMVLYANYSGNGLYALFGDSFNYDSPANTLQPNTSYFFLLKTTITDTNGNAADGGERKEQRLWIYPAGTLPPLVEPVVGGLYVPDSALASGGGVLVNQIELIGNPGQAIDEIRLASAYGQAALPPPPVAAPPVVAASQTASGTVDSAFSYQISASNTPTSYALVGGILPPGLTLNTSTGLLSGTPTASGVYTPSFTATNADGTSPAVTITLTMVNGALIINEPFAYTVGTSGPDPDGGLNSNNGLPASNVGGSPGGTGTGFYGNYGSTLSVAAGLTYAQGTKSLLTSGGSAAPNNATWGAGVAIYRNMATDPFLARRVGSVANGNFAADGQTLFVSFLARSSSTTLRAFRLALGNGSRNVYVVNTGSGKWSLDDNAAGAVTSTGVFTPNTTALLVLRLTFAAGAADTMSLWVDPPLGEVLPSTPDATLTIGADWSFQLLNFRPDVLNAMIADEFRMGTTYGAVTPFAFTSGIAAFRSAYGLAANGSQDQLTPAGDGVASLLKYAFNMIGSGAGQGSTLATPNATVLTPAGSAGLPLRSVDGSGKLRITYIRRKAASNPGITYSVEFSDGLATWATNPAVTETVASLDATFERVTITDSVAAPAQRFARVKVTAP